MTRTNPLFFVLAPAMLLATACGRQGPPPGGLAPAEGSAQPLRIAGEPYRGPAQPGAEPNPDAPPKAPRAEPIPEPTHVDDTRFDLTPGQARMSGNDSMVFDLVNNTSDTIRFHHPGGSSGCATFKWQVHLMADDGTVFDRHIEPDPECALTVMVSPRDYVLAAGAVATRITVDLRNNFQVYKPGDSVGPLDEFPPVKRVPKGHYIVQVRGPGVIGEADLVVD